MLGDRVAGRRFSLLRFSRLAPLLVTSSRYLCALGGIGLLWAGLNPRYRPRRMVMDHTQLIAIYQNNKLPRWQWCKTWNMDTLIARLTQYNCMPAEPEPELEPEPEPEPEPAPVAQPVAEDIWPPSSLEVEHSVIQEIIKQFPPMDRAPMNVGMALTIGTTLGGDYMKMASSAQVRWHALQYIPQGFWRGSLRDFYLGTIHKTSFCYGVPQLDAAGIEAIFDISRTLPARA